MQFYLIDLNLTIVHEVEQRSEVCAFHPAHIYEWMLVLVPSQQDLQCKTAPNCTGLHKMHRSAQNAQNIEWGQGRF
jgi:hypothetical protein